MGQIHFHPSKTEFSSGRELSPRVLSLKLVSVARGLQNSFHRLTILSIAAPDRVIHSSDPHQDSLFAKEASDLECLDLQAYNIDDEQSSQWHFD